MVSENPTDSGVSNVAVTNIVQAKVTADLAVAMASTPEPVAVLLTPSVLLFSAPAPLAVLSWPMLLFKSA